MSSRRRQGQALSPAAAPLDDDDLLSEILLRLPPQPSFLSRASLVCKRWRRLVSDPGFFRRFRLRHRRNPPLLGFFDRYDCRPFVPTLEAPNRVSSRCFSLQRGGSEFFFSLGCRHGLVLIFLPKLLLVIVWDPITGDQHRLAISPGIKFPGGSPIGGAVVRAPGDVHHFQFQVVLVGISDKHTRAVASVYSSETNVWSNLITTPLPASSLHSSEGSPMSDVLTKISTDMPAVLVEDSLYWRLTGTSSSILQFDLDRKSLAVIHVPVLVNLYGVMNGYFSVMRADGGGLGCLLLSEFSIQLWKRKIDCDGVASWVLGRTIEMDKLLSLDYKEILSLMIAGFAEDNNVALIWTVVGLFMIQLESLQFRKLLKTNMSVYHPFESVYIAETGIGGGHCGADFLQYKMIVWSDVLCDVLIEQVSTVLFWCLKWRNGLSSVVSPICMPTEIEPLRTCTVQL